MNILSPLSQIDSIDKLINSGADEFYLGYINPEKLININRRSHALRKGNFLNENELCETIQTINSKGKACYLTLNNHFYPLELMNNVVQVGKMFIEHGGHGLICSDPLLLQAFSKYDFPLILSTCAVCTNRLDIAHYMRLGIKHFVLPRDLKLSEMAELVQLYSDCKFEVFIMNARCRNIESICSAHHCFGGNFCRQLECSDRRYIGRTLNRNMTSKMDYLYYAGRYSNKSCAACYVWDFLQMGVHSLKIVERTIDQRLLINQVSFLKQCISIASCCSSRLEYVTSLKNTFPQYCKCHNTFDCYYIE